MVERSPIVWSCGYGTNSTALAVGLVEHGESYDLAMFADTGGERPELYAYQDILGDYLRRHNLPPVMTVWHTREDCTKETLEQECIRTHSVPSIAYGRYKTCSQKYKIAPQEKVVNNWQPAINAWTRGEKVTKLVGFDADEPGRASQYTESEKYVWRYPLIEWNWGREECIAAIARAGLPKPGKSACFFCPSTKKHELLKLILRHPDLVERAVTMEKNANLTDIKGLGRHFAWADFVQYDKDQIKLLPDPPDMLCACYDGGVEE